MNKRVLTLLAACTAAAVFLPAASILAADAQPAAVESSAASNAPAATPANYRIVEDDILRLDVWGEQQLSNMQMQVTPGGKINVPYLGEMQVVGLTQTEVANEVAKKLADAQIVYDAKVQISLINLHRPQVRVLGAVARPGSYEFKDGDTVMDAVAQGGSYLDDAMLEAATLTSKESDSSVAIDLKKLFNGDLSQNRPLKNGDVIYIPHEDYNNKIYVLGQVNRPGQYSLKENTTLLAAVSLAGGATPRGTIRKTVVVRGDPKKPERVAMDLSKLFDKGDLSQDLQLKSGDIVIVPESKTPDWGKISSIISTVVNMTYLRRNGW